MKSWGVGKKGEADLSETRYLMVKLCFARSVRWHKWESKTKRIMAPNPNDFFPFPFRRWLKLGYPKKKTLLLYHHSFSHHSIHIIPYLSLKIHWFIVDHRILTWARRRATFTAISFPVPGGMMSATRAESSWSNGSNGRKKGIFLMGKLWLSNWWYLMI